MHFPKKVSILSRKTIKKPRYNRGNQLGWYPLGVHWYFGVNWRTLGALKVHMRSILGALFG